jgi:predicted DNA-binding transcriptional regulator AlpA
MALRRALSPREVAANLGGGLTTRTLQRMRATGEFPDPDLWISDKSPRWFEDTVDQWMQSRAAQSAEYQRRATLSAAEAAKNRKRTVRARNKASKKARTSTSAVKEEESRGH